MALIAWTSGTVACRILEEGETLEGSTYNTLTGDGRTILTQDYAELDEFFNNPTPAPEFDYYWGVWR